MKSIANQRSHSRLLIAGALFLTSVIASLLIAYISTTGGKYWLLIRPLPRGVQLTAADIALTNASLGHGAEGYLTSSVNPIGSITLRNLAARTFLNGSDLSENGDYLDSESISIAVKSSDIPSATSIGDLISLYQVFDSRNGEEVLPPQRIIGGVFIRELSQKGANFGGDISLTITLQKDDVPAVLAATASGRLVVVADRG
jgi:hypothetical protein